MGVLTVLKIPYGDEEWYRRTSQDGLAAVDPIYYEPPDDLPFYILPLEILNWSMMPSSILQIYLDLDTIDIDTED